MVLSTTRPNGLSSTLRTRSPCTAPEATPASAFEPATWEAFARLKVTVKVKVVPPPWQPGRHIDLGLQTFRRRPPRKRIAGVARQHPQVEEILPHASRGVTALCSIDEQCRKIGEMFRTRLDGIDPAPLPLVEVGCRQQTADGQNSGEWRADLMRKRCERCLDDTGHGRHGSALARLGRGNAGSAFFRRPPFRQPRGAL